MLNTELRSFFTSLFNIRYWVFDIKILKIMTLWLRGWA